MRTGGSNNFNSIRKELKDQRIFDSRGRAGLSLTMKDKQKLLKAMQQGKIFIYPTDTVYGIGCNALNKRAVAKIKEIKGRDAKKPMSIIAPSKKWIKKNFLINKRTNNRINKYLPGKYTIILKKKDKSFLNHVSPSETLGIRIPKHEFTEYIKKAQVPFITTSANLSGENPASEIKEISASILKKADIIINGGKLAGIPSALILESGRIFKRKK
jgi:L-threonylcarbamoyladenylate synthase